MNNTLHCRSLDYIIAQCINYLDELQNYSRAIRDVYANNNILHYLALPASDPIPTLKMFC